MPAPRPAPTAAPLNETLPGKSSAIAGLTRTNMRTRTRPIKRTVFFSDIENSYQNDACEFETNEISMLRIERHAHEQSGQKRKDIRLQEADKEFEQTQGDNA